MTITKRVFGGAVFAVVGVAGLCSCAADPAPGSTAARVAAETTARVTKVVDGDTLRTTRGKVRLIGVDTPEVGRCNAAAATAEAERIAPVGSWVTLMLPAGENNTDAYGRLLRYVSGQGIDLGGALIKAGVADARYDSLDGFPYHPKQGDYRRWDARYSDRACRG